jgi:hypothetical protein
MIFKYKIFESSLGFESWQKENEAKITITSIIPIPNTIEQEYRNIGPDMRVEGPANVTVSVFVVYFENENFETKHTA